MKRVFILIILAGLLLMPVKAEQVTIIFFHTPGCEHCAQVEEWLQELKGEYGEDLIIKKVDVLSREGWDEFKSYEFTITPAVVINGTIRLQFMEITEESLRKAIQEEIQPPSREMKFWTFALGIISGTTACVLAVAAFMFAMVGSSQSSFKKLLFIALSFGLGLIFVFMVLAVILGIGSYSLTGGGATTVRFYISIILGYIVAILGINQFNYAFEFYKLPISTKRFFERMLEGFLSKKGYIGAFLFGILFAPVKLPCALPALGMVMQQILVDGNLVEGLALAGIYGVGVMIPLLVVAVISGGSAQFASKLRWSDTYRKVSWGIGGIVVLIVSAWIFWNAFKIPAVISTEHIIAFIVIGGIMCVSMILFMRYGHHITKSKTWKKTSRALQRKLQ
jgi:cytochrome c biogenesis protein CcdA/glutaredoxin